MIFWRRKRDPEAERILRVADASLREALSRLGASDVKSRVKKDKVEALASASVGVEEALLVALGELTRALQGAGYSVGGADEILRASGAYLESGSLTGIALGNIMKRTVDTAVASLEVEAPGGRYTLGVQAVKFFGRIGFTVSVSREE